MAALANLKSSKLLLTLVLVELVACLGLGYAWWSQKKILAGKDTQVKDAQSLAQEAEGKVKDAQSKATQAMERLNALQRTSVSASTHQQLVNEVQSLKQAAVSAGLINNPATLTNPEQVCAAVKQLLSKPQISASSASDVDFHVMVVEKEIAREGVIDTKLADKYPICIYHMQKVLDAIGYGFNSTVKTTDQAIMKFQTDNKLKVDGKVGSKTWAKVCESWMAKKGQG